jgi:thiol:disulfide interchange protein
LPFAVSEPAAVAPPTAAFQGFHSPARSVTTVSMSQNLRPLVLIGIVALSVGCVVGVSQWRAAHAHELIPWRSDLAAGQAEAAAQHKPLLVYFTASWCGPCQAMKRTTWADEDVRKAMERYVPVKIDVDEQKAVAERFGIRAMPTYVVMSEGGEPGRRAEGRMEAEDMVTWLRR